MGHVFFWTLLKDFFENLDPSRYRGALLPEESDDQAWDMTSWDSAIEIEICLLQATDFLVEAQREVGDQLGPCSIFSRLRLLPSTSLGQVLSGLCFSKVRFARRFAISSMLLAGRFVMWRRVRAVWRYENGEPKTLGVRSCCGRTCGNTARAPSAGRCSERWQLTGRRSELQQTVETMLALRFQNTSAKSDVTKADCSKVENRTAKFKPQGYQKMVVLCGFELQATVLDNTIYPVFPGAGSVQGVCASAPAATYSLRCPSPFAGLGTLHYKCGQETPVEIMAPDGTEFRDKTENNRDFVRFVRLELVGPFSLTLIVFAHCFCLDLHTLADVVQSHVVSGWHQIAKSQNWLWLIWTKVVREEHNPESTKACDSVTSKAISLFSLFGTQRLDEFLFCVLFCDYGARDSLNLESSDFWLFYLSFFLQAVYRIIVLWFNCHTTSYNYSCAGSVCPDVTGFSRASMHSPSQWTSKKSFTIIQLFKLFECMNWYTLQLV